MLEDHVRLDPPGPSAPPLLLHLGDRLTLFSAQGKELASTPLPRGEGELHRAVKGALPPGSLAWASRLSFPSAQASDTLSIALLGERGVRAQKIAVPLLRRVRTACFSPIPPERLVALAAEDLRATLSSREEQVMVLSREVDRLERLLHREEEVTRHLALASIPGTPVERYLRGTETSRETLRGRLTLAERQLSAEVARLLPNTTRLLGARTASHLLEAASAPEILERGPASRLQLLGARRRTAGHGPRYGRIFLAEGMERVPPGRRGALARTLASLATVAFRADLVTRRDLASVLLDKKERRIRELSRNG